MSRSDMNKRRGGVASIVVRCSSVGRIDLDHLKSSLSDKTKAVVINHGSNVTGTVQPLDQIRAVIGDRTLIVDACQTIGNVPVDVEGQEIDLLCFSCHKSLLGIQGVGALYIRNGIDLTPLKFGGTGSRSESIEQPDMLPDRYESGTPNAPGIASLLGGLTFIEKTGADVIREKKRALRRYLVEGLRGIDGITLHCDPEDGSALPIVSVTMKGVTPADIGYACNRAGICVRVGLHCAPLAHQALGTFPVGAVRISPGYFNSYEDIDRVVEVLRGLEH